MSVMIRRPLYRRILIAVDGSVNAERIIPLVRPVLSALEAAAIVVHVLPTRPGGPDAASGAYLRVLARKLEGHGIDVETALPKGDPALELLRQADARKVDLLALTTHGRGAMARWSLGSVAHKVLRASHQPVLLTRSLGTPVSTVRRILVPLDGSRRSEAALPHAAALAQVFGAEILMLHVATRPGVEARNSKFRRWLRAEKARMESRFSAIRASLAPIPVRTAIDEGDPAVRILQRAGDLPGTLIAMSSHGRTGIRRWAFGSVAEKVLHRTPGPMVIVKSFPPA
jgi:nucleotide-binding universal stress UspA family protein